MGDVINLRQVRKARARVEKDKVAKANRAKFGRTKAERALEHSEVRRQDDQLEQSRLGRKDGAESDQH